MIVGWFMRRVVFPLAVWWQVQKYKHQQRQKTASEELDDDLTDPWG